MNKIIELLIVSTLAFIAAKVVIKICKEIDRI
ncbi:Uncharacterised protein [[Clostridium] sordellii]|nr:Uncharacterised protein [[Clostridium] sordellii] [Paeniclostridium sordellii]